MIKTISFKTLGCRLNQSETDALEGRFREKGFLICEFGKPVDLAVINTCTVTNDADRDSRYAVRRAIRSSAGGRIVVTGCYAQMRPEEVRAISGVDLVLGNSEKFRIFDHLDRLKDGKLEEPLAYVSGGEDRETFAEGFTAATSKTRAILKIQDGCDYHCSFCIIPFARGKARSRSFKAIVDEAERLAGHGFREIVLTGVNIGTYYSHEDGSPRRFVDLVERLEETEGLKRLRISSIEPNTVTEPLLRLMSRSDVICPHLHVPVQSASDPVLAAMRRKYRVSRLRRLLEKIRNLLPEAGIGTDVIVGFPGETDREFEETARFLETSGFAYLHVFPFSTREGTAAAKMKGIDSETKTKRVAALRELSAKLRSDFMDRFVGKTLPVLFEEPEGPFETGLTPNYLRVLIPPSGKNLRGQNIRGTIHNVTLEGIHDPQTLSGQISEN